MSGFGQDNLVTVVMINDKNPKKESNNLVLPEHKWCPPPSPRQRQSENWSSKITQVKSHCLETKLKHKRMWTL